MRERPTKAEPSYVEVRCFDTHVVDVIRYKVGELSQVCTVVHASHLIHHCHTRQANTCTVVGITGMSCGRQRSRENIQMFLQGVLMIKLQVGYI